MKTQLIQLEKNADIYLNLNNSEKMLNETKTWVKYKPKFINAVFYKKRNERFEVFFKYPEDFNEKKLTLQNFSEYFLIDDKLYHGVLKQKNNYIVLFAVTLNQEFLDELSTINDFKIKFRSPNKRSLKMELKNYADSTKINDNTLSLPWVFEYNFLDFNSIKNSKPLERSSNFLLLIDFDKIYNKIKSVNSDSIQDFTKKIIYVLIILFGTFIIISFFIGFRMIRVVTKAINQITKGIQKIRKGDFSVRIKIKSRDQMHYLAESFNEMASGINRLLIEEKEKQRLEEQLRIARSIQLKLLQKETFSSEKFEIEAINIPATEIAGDYFDYFYKKDKYLSILVADVSGKGASAAFYMAELKGLINYLQKKGLSPASLISECHNSLCSSFDKVTFITISTAKFIIPENKFIFSRAGHTQGIFFDAEKEECLELNPEGVAIGLQNFSKEKIKEIELKYKKGDILFLFSDGLSEIMNKKDEILGIDNLKRIIKENNILSPKKIKQKIINFSIKFSGEKENQDDLTFIILKVK